MVEQITLRAYTERIENFLRLGRMDEAVAHATHVLQFYPKNADAYRNLGRALVRQQRYEEAGEIFRRLLAAIPDDFSAHYQLSLVYEQEKRGDAALWHVERAFDQEPNNTQVADRLRELYKKFRDVDVNKIQLTAGAVAKQYTRAGMADRAIDVLKKTLRRMPDRADLRLSLASAMWANNAYVDAAEQAIEVLKTYPYALEANRILTELWLMEDRPSDAQRYLSRIEDIAPYMAYELATDDAVADDQFTLNELDYTRYQASLASQEDIPDWLANVEQVEADTVEEDVTDDLFGDSDFETDEDWLAEIDEISGNTPAPIAEQPKKVTDDLEGLLPDEFDFPDSAGTDDTVAEADMADLPKASTGLTDLLGSLDDDSNVLVDDTDEDLDDLFSDLDDDTGDEDIDALLGDLDADDVSDDDMDDFLASLEDDEDTDGVPAGTGITDLLGDLGVSTDELVDADEDELQDLIEGAGGMTNLVNALEKEDSQASKSILNMLDATDELEETGNTDDLAWLEDISSGVYDTNANAPVSDELVDTEDDFFASLVDEDADFSNPTNQDPLAWLEDAGAEVVDEYDEYAEATNELIEETGDISATDDNTGTVDPNNPLAWLEESGIDFDDTAGEAPLFAPDDEPATFESQDVDPMAWLSEDDDDMLGLDDTEDDMVVPDTDPMAWLQEEDVELLGSEDRNNDIERFAVTNDLASDTDDEMPSDDDMMAWLDPDADTGDFEPVDTDNLVTGTLGSVDAADALDGIEFLDATEGDDAIDSYEVEDDEWLSDDEVLEDLLNIADLTNTDMNEAPDTSELLYDDNTEMQDTMTDGFDPEWNPDDDFEADDDSMAWLQEDDANDSEDAILANEGMEDPMAWLQDGGLEIEEDTEDDFSAEADDDAMAWLQEDADEGDFDNFDDFESVEEIEDSDPLPAQPQNTGMLDFLSNADGDAGDHDDFDFEFDEEDHDDLFDDGADWLRTLDGEEPAAEMPTSEDEASNEDGDWDWGADAGDSNDDDFGFDDDFDALDANGEDAELDWTVEEDFGEEDAVAVDADWLSDLDAPAEDAGDDDDGFDDFDNFEGFG
ncbi:MAG: tetratricopeptide repeat protein, partial [Chloroflexota bacterium]